MVNMYIEISFIFSINLPYNCIELLTTLRIQIIALRPIQLTQCCIQFKPFGNKMSCFRNFHII